MIGRRAGPGSGHGASGTSARGDSPTDTLSLVKRALDVGEWERHCVAGLLSVRRDLRCNFRCDLRCDVGALCYGETCSPLASPMSVAPSLTRGSRGGGRPNESARCAELTAYVPPRRAGLGGVERGAVSRQRTFCSRCGAALETVREQAPFEAARGWSGPSGYLKAPPMKNRPRGPVSVDQRFDQ